MATIYYDSASLITEEISVAGVGWVGYQGTQSTDLLRRQTFFTGDVSEIVSSSGLVFSKEAQFNPSLVPNSEHYYVPVCSNKVSLSYPYIPSNQEVDTIIVYNNEKPDFYNGQQNIESNSLTVFKDWVKNSVCYSCSQGNPSQQLKGLSNFDVTLKSSLGDNAPDLTGKFYMVGIRQYYKTETSVGGYTFYSYYGYIPKKVSPSFSFNKSENTIAYTDQTNDSNIYVSSLTNVYNEIGYGDVNFNIGSATYQYFLNDISISPFIYNSNNETLIDSPTNVKISDYYSTPFQINFNHQSFKTGSNNMNNNEVYHFGIEYSQSNMNTPQTLTSETNGLISVSPPSASIGINQTASFNITISTTSGSGSILQQNCNFRINKGTGVTNLSPTFSYIPTNGNIKYDLVIDFKQVSPTSPLYFTNGSNTITIYSEEYLNSTSIGDNLLIEYEDWVKWFSLISNTRDYTCTIQISFYYKDKLGQTSTIYTVTNNGSNTTAVDLRTPPSTDGIVFQLMKFPSENIPLYTKAGSTAQNRYEFSILQILAELSSKQTITLNPHQPIIPVFSSSPFLDHGSYIPLNAEDIQNNTWPGYNYTYQFQIALTTQEPKYNLDGSLNINYTELTWNTIANNKKALLSLGNIIQRVSGQDYPEQTYFSQYSLDFSNYFQGNVPAYCYYRLYIQSSNGLTSEQPIYGNDYIIINRVDELSTRAYIDSVTELENNNKEISLVFNDYGLNTGSFENNSNYTTNVPVLWQNQYFVSKPMGGFYQISYRIGSSKNELFSKDYISCFEDNYEITYSGTDTSNISSLEIEKFFQGIYSFNKEISTPQKYFIQAKVNFSYAIKQFPSDNYNPTNSGSSTITLDNYYYFTIETEPFLVSKDPPTVSYRRHQVGINTNSFETDQLLHVSTLQVQNENSMNIEKDKIYLSTFNPEGEEVAAALIQIVPGMLKLFPNTTSSSDSDALIIDLDNKKITNLKIESNLQNLIIDGGSW